MVPSASWSTARTDRFRIPNTLQARCCYLQMVGIQIPTVSLESTAGGPARSGPSEPSSRRHHPYAPRWHLDSIWPDTGRVGGYLLDSIILAVIGTLLLIPFGGAFHRMTITVGKSTSHITSFGGHGFGILVQVALVSVYGTLFIGSRRGPDAGDDGRGDPVPRRRHRHLSRAWEGVPTSAYGERPRSRTVHPLDHRHAVPSVGWTKPDDPRQVGSLARCRQPRRASGRIGSNSSTGFPEGSSTMICLPPTPVTISLRKRTPFSRSTSTALARSQTSSMNRLHPPGSCFVPSGMGHEPPPR